MVSVEVIKTAIAERENELKHKFEKEKVVKREKLSEIKKFVSADAVLIITGVRRCGKSFLALMLERNVNFGYVNFEDERLAIDAIELNKVLEAIYSLKGEVNILIFDEIQNIIGWERFVARLLPGKKIIVTGSNATLLSKELATSLTGRHIDFSLFPFSFKEFLDLIDFKPNKYLTKDQVKIKDYLMIYIEKGGFPLAHKLGSVFLAENYKDIIERDVIQRYNIKYVRSFKELAKHLVSNVASEFSFNSLKNVFKIKSVHTVKNYVSYLENAFLVFVLERFSFKLKEQVMAPKKIYCIDTGIVNSIGFKFSENRGRFIENIVALEFFKKKVFNKNAEVFYWKDHQQNEVDFVIKEKNKVKQLVQTTYAKSRQEIMEREIKSLLKASEELKCSNLLVITWDFESEEKIKRKKIKFIPLWKWLLQNN